MINKIHPELLKSVSTLCTKNIDCFLYANDYVALHKYLIKDNIAHLDYPLINGFFVSVPASKVVPLSRLSSLNFITKSAKVSTLINRAKDFMQTNSLSADITPTIAFIDTGIAPHLDFLLPYKRIIHFKDLINNRLEPYDDNGHGTFIAGVCAGSGICSQLKFAGVAPRANIVMIKALDSKGETSSPIILEAMEYIYNIRKKYNIKVVCMSFGADYSGTNDPLQKGALALWNSGLVVVVAGGNSGPDMSSIKSPGTSPRVITVGGLDEGRNDGLIKVADFSSRGPVEHWFKPDLIAPSVDITSTNHNFKQGFYTTMFLCNAKSVI